MIIRQMLNSSQEWHTQRFLECPVDIMLLVSILLHHEVNRMIKTSVQLAWRLFQVQQWQVVLKLLSLSHQYRTTLVIMLDSMHYLCYHIQCIQSLLTALLQLILCIQNEIQKMLLQMQQMLADKKI
ncbi:unnamed protein product [Paramecium octaurelia]|uniref:Uncharacterized protein n=1 Tax=Paramecium octaurelia TaxID=43137 RepID=A0A8S1V5P7_PAROT|nr:unnamed protein product [Paramecium octaurelia]